MYVISGLPWWLSGKESACEAGDACTILRSRRSPGEGNGNPLSILAWKSHGCREPARDIPLVTKVMRKGARHTQRRDQASGVPPDILEHLPPKNQSLPTLLPCALTSDFTGGCPPPPSHSLCQRVNLQLQLIKFLGN